MHMTLAAGDIPLTAWQRSKLADNFFRHLNLAFQPSEYAQACIVSLLDLASLMLCLLMSLQQPQCIWNTITIQAFYW